MKTIALRLRRGTPAPGGRDRLERHVDVGKFDSELVGTGSAVLERSLGVRAQFGYTAPIGTTDHGRMGRLSVHPAYAQRLLGVQQQGGPRP